jgi:hypothetical protein
MTAESGHFSRICGLSQTTSTLPILLCRISFLMQRFLMSDDFDIIRDGFGHK